MYAARVCVCVCVFKSMIKIAYKRNARVRGSLEVLRGHTVRRFYWRHTRVLCTRNILECKMCLPPQNGFWWIEDFCGCAFIYYTLPPILLWQTWSWLNEKWRADGEKNEWNVVHGTRSTMHAMHECTFALPPLPPPLLPPSPPMKTDDGYDLVKFAIGTFSAIKLPSRASERRCDAVGCAVDLEIFVRNWVHRPIR